MVHITRITFQGFKSFNKKLEVEMPFGLVCIAGPNGSGKSNVFDSIGFVLGELSSKTLRTENLGSLIYNGGQKGKEAHRAKVEIVFDNKERRISIDADEVRVSREINKNGQGIYRINGQMATRSRIVSLLDEVGIDPRGYSIVKQGQIAHLVDMTDKERLVTLSDISGISTYEEKKEKSLKELEKVEKKLNDAKIILHEKEKQLKEIEKEKRQAEKYNEMVLRLRTLKASFLDKTLKELSTDAGADQEQIKRIEERKNEVEKELNDVKLLIDEFRKELTLIDEDIQRKGGEERLKLGEKIEELKEKRAEARANMLSSKREIGRIEERKNDLERNFALNKQDITVLEREISKLNEEIKTRETSLKEFEQGNEAKAQDQLFELQLKFNSVSNDIINKRSKNAKVGRTSEVIERRNRLKREREDNLKITETIKKELNTLLDEESNSIGKIRGLRDELEKLNKQLSTFEVQKGAYEKSLDYSVRRIIEKQKEMRGIHGTVESLCRVPEEYALSIQVAMGGKRNNIIVENEDIAKECVEFLKKEQIGIATFLPLNKIKAQQTEKTTQHDEMIGYAIELVKFEPKYYNIFAYILLDTIIIRNFETAKKIGFGKNPMVTLEGDYISKQGSVTGGYRKQIKTSSLGQNIDSKIEQINSEIEQVRNDLMELNQKKENLTNKIIQFREERSATESRLANINAELEELNETLKAVDEKDKALEEIEKLEKEKEKIGIEIGKLAKITDSKMQGDYEKLREETNNLKIKFASYTAKLNNILAPEQKNLQKVIKDNEDDKKNFQKQTKEQTKQFDETAKELNKLEKEFEKIDGDIKGLYQKKTRTQNKAEREEKRIEEKNEQIKSYDTKIIAKNMKLVEKTEKIRSIKEQLTEYEGVEIIRLVGTEERKEEMKLLEKEINRAGPINQKALEMYNEVKAGYDIIFGKFSVIDGERNDVLLLIDEIEKKKTATFMKTYNAIAQNFKRVFENLTGGEGHLDLTDTEKPLEGGVDIRVRTREEKKLTHLRALSGGEKTITALAFIFAIQEYNPTPFYVMDEIDAALDKENSEKLARLLKKYSEQAQMILISHNDAVISAADYLYGASMNKLGESTLIGIKLPKE